MIFVVGIPRSGTTWVSSLLAEHPECERLTAEVLGFKMPAVTLETGLFLRGLSDSEIRTLVPPNEKRWVEKTPDHYFHIENIRRVFPGAQIVLIKRRREDVIRSMLNAKHWDGRPRSRHAAEVLHDRYAAVDYAGFDHEVNYRQLWLDPVTQTQWLYDALGLDWIPAREAVERTRYGRNLPPELKEAFQGGEPHL